MGAGFFLIILPICVMILQIRGEPVSDPPLANEDSCILMTDAKLTEIDNIVKELTDFINALADKHENFDLRLVKLDIEKHIEDDAEDRSTILELFVNNCNNEAGNFKSSYDSNKANSNTEDKLSEQSISNDVHTYDHVNTSRETKEDYYASEDLKEAQIVSIQSGEDIKKSTKSRNKKIINRVTTKNSKKDKLVKDDNTISDKIANKSSTDDTNINYKDESSNTVENTSNNGKNIRKDEFYLENNIVTLVKNIDDDVHQSSSTVENVNNNVDNNYQSNNAENVSNYNDVLTDNAFVENNESDNNIDVQTSRKVKNTNHTNKNINSNTQDIYTTDKNNDKNIAVSSSNESGDVDCEDDTTSTDDDDYLENDSATVTKTNKHQSTEKDKNINNYTNDISSDNVYVENNKKTSVINKDSGAESNYSEENNNIVNNSIDYAEHVKESSVKTVINEEQFTKREENIKSSIDVNNLTELKKNMNEVKVNDEKSGFNSNESKSTGNTNRNTSKQLNFNLSESQLVQSLKQIIKAEVVNNMRLSNITNLIKDKKDNDLNKDCSKSEVNDDDDDYTSESKPQLVWLNFQDNEFLNDRQRKRCKSSPWLVYLQEQRGQRQITIL